MSWSIGLIDNEPKITKACAKDLYAAQEHSDYGEFWYDEDDVAYNGKLHFNPDHMEWMSAPMNDPVIIHVLKKHKVKGKITFGSLEGDNDGSFWGVEFDGKGGAFDLTGKVVWEKGGPSESAEPKPKKTQGSSENATLYYSEGTSDKVYKVRLDYTNVDSGWFVEAQYGRRNGNLRTEDKGSDLSHDDAKLIYDKVVAEKIKKGYVLEEAEELDEEEEYA